MVLIGTYNDFDMRLLVLSFIFMAWGCIAIWHKKMNLQDRGYFVYGALLFGLAIFGATTILITDKEVADEIGKVDFFTVILLLLGGLALVVNGLKEIRKNKHSNK